MILKLIEDKKMFPDRYFINDKGLLHKAVKEDYKLLYALVVPRPLSKYIFHQMHELL